jgi:hypothetical protein
MKIILTIVFLFMSVAFQNSAMAGCDKFNLVEAPKVMDIIAKYKNRILDSSGTLVKKIDSICMNPISGSDKWSISINCNTSSCKAIDAGKVRVQTEYPGQPNFHLIELAEVKPTGCNAPRTPSNDGEEASGIKANP